MGWMKERDKPETVQKRGYNKKEPYRKEYKRVKKKKGRKKSIYAILNHEWVSCRAFIWRAENVYSKIGFAGWEGILSSLDATLTTCCFCHNSSYRDQRAHTCT
jgi:hypothetical protein